jgi:RNA recognition motif 2
MSRMDELSVKNTFLNVSLPRKRVSMCSSISECGDSPRTRADTFSNSSFIFEYPPSRTILRRQTLPTVTLTESEETSDRSSSKSSSPRRVSLPVNLTPGTQTKPNRKISGQPLTVMLKNISGRITTSELLEYILRRKHKPDLVYVPVDCHTLNCLGYAFITFPDSEALKIFTFDFTDHLLPDCRKRCEIVLAKTQGLEQNLKQLNNTVFLKGLPDELKPKLLLENKRYVSIPVNRK